MAANNSAKGQKEKNPCKKVLTSATKSAKVCTIKQGGKVMIKFVFAVAYGFYYYFLCRVIEVCAAIRTEFMVRILIRSFKAARTSSVQLFVSPLNLQKEISQNEKAYFSHLCACNGVTLQPAAAPLPQQPPKLPQLPPRLRPRTFPPTRPSSSASPARPAPRT